MKYDLMEQKFISISEKRMEDVSYGPKYILKYSASIINKHFVYISRLNDYNCNDGTQMLNITDCMFQ